MGDAEVLKALLSMGGPGVVAAVMWVISKRYMDLHARQVEVTQQEMSKRIDAAEKSNKECQEHRIELQAQIVEILQEKREKR